MKIWLDDLRNPTLYNYNLKGQTFWAKNYTGFVEGLNKFKDVVEEISFDNDLGEEKEGYDCFVLVEEMLYNNGLPKLKTIKVHTSNPSAAKKFMVAKESLQSRFNIDMIRVNY